MLYALYYPQSMQTENQMPLSASVPLFHFTIERMRHYWGEWHSMTAVLFPDYLFIDCEKDEAEEVKGKLEEEVSQGKNFKQQLPLVRIPDELSGLLYDLCDKDHHISMSKGIISNGRTHVTEGPLTGYDSRIIRIDRHKRLAWLKYSDDIAQTVSKDSTSVLMAGLEITERMS